MNSTWLKKLTRRSPSHATRQRSPRLQAERVKIKPWLEMLEDRMAPAVFAVNTLGDTVAANLTTGQDASGNISLRSAIQAANNLGGANSINLPAGNYNLTIAGAGEDNAATGDLDIKNNLTIIGLGGGPANVTINANSLDRVFQVFGFTVAMSNLTIEGGQANQGGGILNIGSLTLTNVAVFNNLAVGVDGTPGGPAPTGGSGGGIYNASILTLNSSSVRNNAAQGGNNLPSFVINNGQPGAPGATGDPGGPGDIGDTGGSGSVAITSGPGATALGGGIYNSGTVTINASSVDGNTVTGGQGTPGGSAYGAGINDTGGTVTITNSEFSNDTAFGGRGLDGNSVTATGGLGGAGGTGGVPPGPGQPGGDGGTGGAGGPGSAGLSGSTGGIAFGGGIFLNGGLNPASLIITASTFASDAAFGGNGGNGGAGGPGGAGGVGGAAGSIHVPGGDGGTGGIGGIGGTGGTGGVGQGGAIFSINGTLILDRVTLNANQALGGSGGIGGPGGPGGSGGKNTGAFSQGGGGGQGGTGGTGGAGYLGEGGAISANSSSLISESTISGNQAHDGLGLFGGNGGPGGPGFGTANSGSAGAAGGAGINGFGYAGGLHAPSTIQIINTIVAGNTATTSSADVMGNFTSQGHNFIGDGSGSIGFTAVGDQVGTSANPINALLGPLQNNRGPTLTMLPLPNSPVIDAGDNTGAPTTDQRGQPRIMDGKGTGIAIIDIGAVEFQPPDVSIALTASPGTVLTSQNVSYTLTVHTTGDKNATNLTIASAVPLHTTFQSLTQPGGWTISTPVVGNMGAISATISSMSPGTQAVFTLVVQVIYGTHGGTPLPASATVGISSPDSTPVDNAASAMSQVATKPAGIVGRLAQNGQWWIGASNGSSAFANAMWAGWNPAVTWVDVQTGDFNGDGRTDIVGRDLQTGNWWVGLSNGSSFTTTLWGNWNPNVTWVDVKVGDFNGDGKGDIVGRFQQTGQWWVATSTGSSFNNALWATWNSNVAWVDVQAGNFNGDGKEDIIGRYLQGGQWFVGLSTGSSFNTSVWATWNPNVTWVDAKVGDFNGDGKDDIIARYLQGGQWYAGISTGSAFNTSLWATWNPAATWVDVQVGDLNGDGKADIIGRYLQGGQWFVGQSTGSSLNTSLWATWNPSITWVDAQVADFNGDGKDDITARYSQGGQWFTGISTGSSFNTTLWDTWSTAVTWVDVHAGGYV